MTLLDLIQSLMNPPTANQQLGQQFAQVQQQGGVSPQVLQQQVKQQMYAQPKLSKQQTLLDLLRLLGGK
jgi:hypothetical protein